MANDGPYPSRPQADLADEVTPAAPSRPAPGHPRPPARRPRLARRLLSWLFIVVAAVVVAVLLRTFVVQTFFVPSGSMIPTLLPGDRILVQKIGYSIGEGAVVVFKTPPGYRPGSCGGTPEADLVKRVIGLPGETIMSVGNDVYIDGKRLAEPYLPKGQSLGAPITQQKIPPGEYFVMGDNRPVSCDSRVWGLVPRRDIIGRVFLVIWRHGLPDFKII